MKLPSASRLPCVMACPSSHLLPQVQRDNAYSLGGTAKHRFLHAVRRSGRIAALKEVPEAYRAECEAIDVAALPIAGDPEVPLAWDWKKDEGRYINAKARDYSSVSETEFCGTADLIDIAGHTVDVFDYKSGWLPVEPDNWQAKMLCLAAARANEMDTARSTILKLKDGKVIPISFEFDGFALDAIAVELAALAKRLPNATGYNEGEHCRYCPAFRHCPAKNALIVRPVDCETELVSVAQLGVRYEQIQRAKVALALAEELIEEHAAHEEIPLPNGKTLRLVDDARESIDATIAYAAILEGWGVDAANKAVENKCSKASIKRALNGAHEEAIERIRQRGGVKVTVKSSVKAI